MRQVIAGLTLILASCDLQPNYILVMTTFDANGSAPAETVIRGSRSKEKCQFAGDQWITGTKPSPGSLGTNDRFVFTCLEPKP